VGASSFINNRRFTNTESIDEYVHCILSGKVAEVFSEEVIGEDAKSEFAMLALRTAKGLDKNLYKKEFNSDFEFDFAYALKKNAKFLYVTKCYRRQILLPVRFFLSLNFVVISTFFGIWKENVKRVKRRTQ
jgi:coproporphyrinogen III oxidase-like Fe-S oxidoreductase